VTEQFIGAAIQMVAGTLDATRMSAGEPGLPRQFQWGSQTVRIVQVLKGSLMAGARCGLSVNFRPNTPLTLHKHSTSRLRRCSVGYTHVIENPLFSRVFAVRV
jgi:hypothetical protein